MASKLATRLGRKPSAIAASDGVSGEPPRHLSVRWREASEEAAHAQTDESVTFGAPRNAVRRLVPIRLLWRHRVRIDRSQHDQLWTRAGTLPSEGTSTRARALRVPQLREGTLYRALPGTR